MKEVICELNINNKLIKLSSGKIAKQANASVLAECEGTAILATATMGKNAIEDPGFFPLSVHYMEKYYAGGRIPGGFIKREGKPSDKAVLTSRIIDRSLRPLFPEGFRNEVQVVPNVIAVGNSFPADILATIASSCALYISDIPFNNPIGCVRVALIENQLIVNPSPLAIKNSRLDLTVSGNTEGITMIEGISDIISDQQMIEAIELGFLEIQQQIKLQNELKSLCGKEKKDVPLFTFNSKLVEEVEEYGKDKIISTFNLKEKLKRVEALDIVFDDIQKHFSEKYADNNDLSQIPAISNELEYKLVRDRLFKDKIRIDERKPDEIRNIECEVALFESLHGSSLFTRGETQSLGVLTLGAFQDSQRVEDLELKEFSKNYFLHYNFPPFSVGESGRIGPPGRREVGHGYLAEKSLKAVLPKYEDFPYVIRLVSEILESNGSSSMASVCSCSMALMDGGVPVTSHVAGIAMGLMYNAHKTEYEILTDIQGLEDHYGDIDFKVAGTYNGITAFQLDIKMDAVKIDILKEALQKAYEARIKILDKMNKVISSPRKEISSFAPQIFTILANSNNIKYLIGPSGKNIKALSETYGISIDIENDSIIRVAAPNNEIANLAKEKIHFMVRDVNIGEIIEGKIVKIVTFGAFIEVAYGREGLCHISQIAKERIQKVEDVLSVGELVKVKVIDIDKQGKIVLSIKDIAVNTN